MTELLRELPKGESLRSNPLLRFAVPVVLVGLALILTGVSDSKFVFFLGAIVISAWWGGLLPGLLATLLAVLAADYLLPNAQGLTDNGEEWLQVVMFVLLAAFISWMEHQRLTSETKLTDANARLQVVIANVTDGITVQDRDGKVLVANDAAATLTGYTSTNDLLGLQMDSIRRRYELFNLDGTTFPYENLPRHRVFHDGTPHKVSFRMRFGDTDEERWVEVKSAPVRDADGNVQMAVNIFRDVTQDKQYEAALDEERAYLRKVLNNVVAFVAVLNTDGILIEANAPALQVVETPADQLLGKHLADTAPWSYAPALQTQLRDAITRVQKGETVRYDTQVRVAADQLMTIDLMIAPLLNDAGAVEMIIASAFDITERRRKEEHLAHMTMLLDAQRQRLSRIMHAIPAIVFEGTNSPRDGEQTLDFVNDYAEKMLGYPIQNWRDDLHFGEKVIHPEDIERVMQEATEIFEKRAAGSMSFRYLAADGRTVYAEAHTNIIRDNNGLPIGACGVIMDVTSRKQAELALAEQAEELRRSNQELEQFAYIASHDLQEPLRMVTSYLQLLDQRYGERLDGEAREFMDFAVDGANRMKKLIQDLLAYSRVQRNRNPFTSVDLDGVLDAAMKNLEVPIADSGATISFGTLPTVPGDEGLLTQLFQNLIGNAIKFRRDENVLIKIDHEPRGHEWVFSVRDNGIGIDAKYLDRVFDIFQRLHPASKYPGTGIGLAICRRIVEHHGGRIWAESEVGVGTTFFFALPRALTSAKSPKLLVQEMGTT